MEFCHRSDRTNSDHIGRLCERCADCAPGVLYVHLAFHARRSLVQFVCAKIAPKFVSKKLGTLHEFLWYHHMACFHRRLDKFLWKNLCAEQSHGPKGPLLS